MKYLRPLPAHDVYVEVFGGGATLLFTKEPAQIEVYNDLHEGLVNFFLVLQHKYREDETGHTLHSLLEMTPHSRQEYKFCRDNWNAPDADEFEKARRFFVAMHQSHSAGRKAGWRLCRTKENSDKPPFKLSPATSRYLSAVNRLPEAVQRLRSVQIDGDDFEVCIRRYDAPTTLFYLDPPYIHTTRVETQSYAYEMDDDEHRRLVSVLLDIKGMAVLSGYDHEIYHPLGRNGWVRGVVERSNSAAKKKRGEKRDTVEEFLWFSPTYPKEAIRAGGIT